MFAPHSSAYTGDCRSEGKAGQSRLHDQSMTRVIPGDERPETDGMHDPSMRTLRSGYALTIRYSHLANPRQRVAYEHVYHAGAAEQGVHHDHARRFLANFAYDGRFFPSVDVSQGFEGGVRRFGCDYRK